MNVNHFTRHIALSHRYENKRTSQACPNCIALTGIAFGEQWYWRELKQSKRSEHPEHNIGCARGVGFREMTDFCAHVAALMCSALLDAFDQVRGDDECCCGDDTCEHCEDLSDECCVTPHTFTMDELESWAELFLEQYIDGMTLSATPWGWSTDKTIIERKES